MKVYRKRLLLLVLLLLAPITLMANERQAAISAVESIMFDIDELGVEYVNYRVDASGNVSMTVDDTVPEDLYAKLLNLLRADKAINSVLASQGAVCPIPYIRNGEQ